MNFLARDPDGERIAALEAENEKLREELEVARLAIDFAAIDRFEAFTAGFALARHETAVLDLREAFEEWLMR